MRFPGKCRRTSTDPLFLISVSMGDRLEKRSPIFIGGTMIRNRVDMDTHDLPFGERSKISKPRCDPLHAPGGWQALERTTSRGNHGNAQKLPGTILVRTFRRKFNRTIPMRMGAPVNPPQTHKCRWREKCHRKQSSTPMHAARASVGSTLVAVVCHLNDGLSAFARRFMHALHESRQRQRRSGHSAVPALDRPFQ